jgi:thiol-disulfide isomerase/thioredoxin
MLKKYLLSAGIVVIALTMTSIPRIRVLQAQENVTIDNIIFGELWMGEELTKEDLKDHVVGVEFWGKWCQSCRAALPHLVKWYEKYSPKGFILLGFHSTRNETKEQVISLCKGLKITFNIYNGGNVTGLDIKGIPHFVLFDHKGNLAYSGHPMEAEADKKLDEAMKSAPDFLVGEGPYKKLTALVEKIKQRKELGKVLTTLKTKHLNSEDETEKTEAEQLISRLEGYGNKLLGRANKKKDTEPLNCFNIYQEVVILFKGDEIGNTADNALKELKEDKTFQDNLKADKEYLEIEKEVDKFKGCNKCAIFSKTCNDCQKKNPQFEPTFQKAKTLVKKYPSSPAASKVKEILPVE